MIIFIVAIHVLWKVQNVDFRIQVVGFVSHDNMHHSDSNIDRRKNCNISQLSSLQKLLNISLSIEEEA
jgi:hypothetical protein